MAIDLTIPIYALLMVPILGISLVSYLCAFFMKRLVLRLQAARVVDDSEQSSQRVAAGRRVPAVSGGA